MTAPQVCVFFKPSPRDDRATLMVSIHQATWPVNDRVTFYHQICVTFTLQLGYVKSSQWNVMFHAHGYIGWEVQYFPINNIIVDNFLPHLYFLYASSQVNKLMQLFRGINSKWQGCHIFCHVQIICKNKQIHVFTMATPRRGFFLDERWLEYLIKYQNTLLAWQ